MRLLECVANISEGKSRSKIDQLSAAISEGGSTLLHIDSGESANRSVFTFAGSPEDVCNSAFLLSAAARDLIDMRYHSGEHPCIGAADVLPLIPLAGLSLVECKQLAWNLADRIWKELKVPCYLYAANAANNKPRKLNDLRGKSFAQLNQQITLSDLKPDIGEGLHHTAGISIVGARDLMLAFNINLETKSIDLGRRIARRLRAIRDSRLKRAGKSLDSVMFMAWYLSDRDLVQISTNIYDFREAPLDFIFDLVRELAQEIGIQVTGSEIIGMLPIAALLSDRQLPESELTLALEKKVADLNLNDLEPFNINQRILELALKKSFNFDLPRL